jgi:regulator of replication initiation timing
LSTRKLGVYASKEEFLENEVRTLSHHIQSMIDTMKVMSMNRQHMLEEIARLTAENEALKGVHSDVKN